MTVHRTHEVSKHGERCVFSAKATRTIGALLVLALAIFIFDSSGWAATLDKWQRQMIESNALLRTIYKGDPKKATELASEARRLLSQYERNRTTANDLELNFRGTHGADEKAEKDGEILARNRKDFDENPILREIYARSPLASLRMLKRLREAAKKTN